METSLIRFGWLVNEVDVRNSSEFNYPLMSVSQYKGVIPRAELMGDSGRAESLDNYKICTSGDLVVNRMSASSGALGFAHDNGLVSPDYAVLRPTPLAHGPFLAYLMKSNWFVGEMIARLRGIGAGGDGGSVRTPRINIADLKDIVVSLPTLGEQRRIADYLDSKMDTLGKLADLNRSLLIQNSQNLNSSIDQEFIATGAKTIELRRVAKFSSRKKVDLLPTVSLDLVISKRGALNVAELPYSKGETSTWMAPGDVGFGKLRPYLGKVFLADTPTFAESEFVVMSPDENRLWPRYFRNFLLTRKVLDELESLSVGAKMPRTSWDQISTLRIPLPPVDQQIQICERILELENRATLKESYLGQMLESIGEYKTSLITAGITGTLDVSTGRSVA